MSNLNLRFPAEGWWLMPPLSTFFSATGIELELGIEPLIKLNLSTSAKLPLTRLGQVRCLTYDVIVKPLHDKKMSQFLTLQCQEGFLRQMQLSECSKLPGTHISHIFDISPRSHGVRSITWPPHYRSMGKLGAVKTFSSITPDPIEIRNRERRQEETMQFRSEWYAA